MALSDRYKKSRDRIANERERLAVERAKASVQKVLESDQFRLSALALPESQMQVDTIMETTVKATLDPIGQLNDTLRAKGFRPAEVRSIVQRLYTAYIRKFDENDIPPYEVMEKEVAYYVESHQELYNSVDVEQLRE